MTLRWKLRWPEAGLLALLVASALAAYWPALSAGFIWNDSDYVTAPELRSLAGLLKIWFKVGATQQYYPLLHSMFWVEHRLWGDHPLGYHLFNILVHAANGALFVALLKRLRVPGAWLAGFIFVLHPVYAESVAWITEEKNTVSTLFYLASAWLFAGPDGDLAPSRSRRWWAFGLFAIAILSKSVAATLPAALLVAVWWRRGRIDWRRDARPLLPWFGAALAIGVFTGWVERTYIGAKGSNFNFNLLERGLIAGHVVWFDLGKLILPIRLVFIYPRWQIDAHQPVQYLYPAALIAVLALLWSIRGKARAPLACALLFVGGLTPTIGFFNVYAFIFSFVADHWQYIAGLALIALFASAVARSRAPVWLVAVPILGALGLLTHEEAKGYHDPVGFYRRIIERNPASWMAHNNLGEIELHDGDIPGARSEFEAALKARPDYAEAESNLGLAYLAVGDARGALVHLDRACVLRPDVAIYHGNRGIALAAVNRIEEAKAEYTKALEEQPVFPQIYFDFGLLWTTLKRPDLAAAAFHQAVQQNPEDYECWFQLGILDAAAGRMAESANDLHRAMAINPADVRAEREYGNLLRQTGHLSEALAIEEATAAKAPNDGPTHYYLGLTYGSLKRWDEAIAQYLTALRINPGYAEADNDLALAYSATKRPGEAIAAEQRALAIRPDFAEAENNLGVFIAEHGKMADAVPHFQRAVKLNPNYANAWQNLSRVDALVGRAEEAKAAAAKAAALQPAPAKP